MKKFFALAAATFALAALPPVLTAQEDGVARFKGLAVEAHFANLYAAGGLSDHLLCVAGAGLGVEWTLPLNFAALIWARAFALTGRNMFPKASENLTAALTFLLCPEFLSAFRSNWAIWTLPFSRNFLTDLPLNVQKGGAV